MPRNQICPTNDFVEFKKQAIEQSISSRFEEMAARHPERIAIKSANRAYTYSRLNQEANRIARGILKQQGVGGEQIALIMANSLMVAAFLGVLKAGKSYVPIDPSYPTDIATSMLEDSEAKLLISDKRNFLRAQEIAPRHCRVVDLDSLDIDVSTENLGASQTPNAIAYVVYTSGSTGRPKGVVQNHRNVLHCVMRYTNAMHISTEDRLTLLHSCGFSAARIDIYSALLNGATLLPFDVDEVGHARLSDWMSREEITIYHYIPTAFRNFVGNMLSKTEFPKLRLIVLGSEPLYKRDVELYKAHFSSDCILVNRMGTSEAGNTHFYFMNAETPIQGTTIPVGYPVEDNETLLLNEARELVDAGEVGEIAIKSLYLSQGYWKNSRLTKSAFLCNSDEEGQRIYLTGDMGQIRADGSLVHLGRKDFQVKLKGHWVNIPAVENALLECDTVEKAVVHARADRSGGQRLVAYVVPTARARPTASELRLALSNSLPEYMVPSNFVILEDLPLTATGKVNRLALPNPGTERPDLTVPFAPPVTTIERELERIWSSVLEIDHVGVHDPFLELGGDSLCATQIISRILVKFRAEVSVRCLLFEAPTIAKIAAVIGNCKSNESWAGEVQKP